MANEKFSRVVWCYQVQVDAIMVIQLKLIIAQQLLCHRNGIQFCATDALGALSQQNLTDQS